MLKWAAVVAAVAVAVALGRLNLVRMLNSLLGRFVRQNDTDVVRPHFEYCMSDLTLSSFEYLRDVVASFRYCYQPCQMICVAMPTVSLNFV